MKLKFVDKKEIYNTNLVFHLSQGGDDDGDGRMTDYSSITVGSSKKSYIFTSRIPSSS